MEGGSDLDPVTYADKGWKVVTAHLGGYRCEEAAYASNAFAISPDDKAQSLWEGLRMVDAGDFDGDGKSERVFAIQMGNTGGTSCFSTTSPGRRSSPSTLTEREFDCSAACCGRMPYGLSGRPLFRGLMTDCHDVQRRATEAPGSP